jgi:phage terminase large subunit
LAASPYAFTVGAEVFFDPHPGAQLDAVQKIAARVMRGEGPRRFFLRGNRGGGKSFAVRRGVCHALAMAIPGLKYVVVRRNMPDLRQNHLIYVGSEMRKLGGEWNETFGLARYPNGSMGFYRQCEDDKDVEKVVGSEAAILFVDEAPQIKWEHQRTMAPSLRVPRLADGTVPYYTCEIYSGNPMGESIDEMDKFFIEKDVDPYEEPGYDPNDWAVIDIHLKDNPSLDPQEYLKQFAGLPAHFRAAWVDGLRIESRTLFEVHPRKHGKPYHYIQELPTVGTVPLLKVPWVQIYRAFDMGFFPDPAVCLWLAVLGNRVIVFHEETWFRTIAADLAIKIREITTELTGSPDCAMTLVDPKISIKTGSDVVTVQDMLEMHGVPCEPSINDRILYADAIHGLLGEEVEPGVPRLQIYEPGCPMLAKYLPKMRWDETNERKMADHKFDHWPICLAYFAISSGVLSVTRAEEIRNEPIWMTWMREAPARNGRRRA